MMPPPVFVALAATMVIAALLLIVLPLTRGEDSAPISAAIVVALLPLAATVLYFTWSNWRWDQPATPVAAAHADPSAPSIDEAIARLEQRLQSNPDDTEGWLMLGRSYAVTSRYPEAVEAYGRARQLSNDTEVHAITGYAEALAMARGGVIDDEAAGLFERALALAPDDSKALWYGGLTAMESGRPAQARERWQRLLTAGPPEEVAQVLREQIAVATAMLGETDSSTVTPAAATGGLSVKVSLANDLAGRAGPNVPVFILARQVDMPGPPLAVVRRRVADLPLRVVLSDADAMVPGNVLSAHDNVEVVARVALGGTPVAQTGDFAGSRIVASDGQADIVIDTVVNP